ncbi:FG-GAP repeat domain-containing protein [Nannocystis radixulma]|uniref:VCBS repeat-containing protein n=1 Tax=Nannocystis radixulma TaxID=2995305 RepID=A0ABT5BDD6_9BACT|nr:VCBS repeat-containing protein [Nannocystis radixulma]MDC0672072.1 VCBS repeat-containing protein [Nannocystis radixulma]
MTTTRRALGLLALLTACGGRGHEREHDAGDRVSRHARARPAASPSPEPAAAAPAPSPPPPPAPAATPEPAAPAGELRTSCFARRRDIPHPRTALGDLVDVDHDGRLDLVVTGALDHNVDVLLGVPGGRYELATSLEIDGDYIGLTLADFDGDGHLDFAASSHAIESVVLYKGAGDGSFARAQEPVHVAKFVGRGVAADFTGDGRLDLAVPIFANMVVLKNDRGRLRAGPRIPVGQAPENPLAADLDRDGRLDLLAASNDAHRLDVLMAKGPGTFKPVRSYPCGEGGHSLAVADLTGDGLLDVAMSNTHSRDLCVLRGDGEGGFSVHARLPLGPGAGRVTIADLTGDGRLDLLASAWHPIGHELDLKGSGPREFVPPDGVIEAYAGDGAGGFTHHSTTAAGQQPNDFWLVDTHGDEALDLVILNTGSDSITILSGAACQPRAPLLGQRREHPLRRAK